MMTFVYDQKVRPQFPMLILFFKWPLGYGPLGMYDDLQCSVKGPSFYHVKE